MPTAPLRATSAGTPQPLAALPAERLARLRAVLTDIDDTLTTDGRLPAASYAALERLSEAGLAVVPITGRPAGWCDMIARFWPVAGVVGENGALAYWMDRAAGRVRRLHSLEEAARAAGRARLDRLEREILAAVPGSAVAADQFCRAVDLAIDYAEDVPRLSDAAVARIVALAGAAGATAKVSSIHVNIWFGEHDKLSMARRFLGEACAIDIDGDRGACLFAGDSPNDAPMFGHFPLSVGVANVVAFLDRMEAQPAYVTRAAGGAGFVEIAEAVLAARPAAGARP